METKTNPCTKIVGTFEHRDHFFFFRCVNAADLESSEENC